mgnify:FL=1
MVQRPFSHAVGRLRATGLRPTRQRLALARLLLDGGDRHVTAETLHNEASTRGMRVSLATVYNTLHQFTRAGLLRQVTVDASKTYFDTNTSDHQHFLFEETGELRDIPADTVLLSQMPAAPAGSEIRRVDVVSRVGPVKA